MMICYYYFYIFIGFQVITTWDIKDQSPLQHLNIKFPSTGTLLEHGGFPLCMASTHSSLFVAAEDCVAELKLTTAGNCKQNTSHKGCVVAVYHIQQKNQVICTNFTYFKDWFSSCCLSYKVTFLVSLEVQLPCHNLKDIYWHNLIFLLVAPP